MEANSIILLGSGGHARACIDVIEQEGVFKVVGLLGLSHEVGSRVLGYPVLGTDADLPNLLSDFTHALVTIGQIKSPEQRMRLFALLENNNCSLPIIVSPRAYVSPHALLGAGTIVMHGAVVNAGAKVGHNCIVNSQALIEHDVIVEDHCHIATAATINSGVHIATGTFIGSNSSVRQLITIGKSCLIGMGQQVTANCEAGTHLPIPKEPI
jgi:sugar O-acyltransferase (sialic acid O-acetyltransferase NeuD family)